MRPWSSESGCVARLPHAAVPGGVHAPPRQLGAPAVERGPRKMATRQLRERQCGTRRSSLAVAMRAINSAAFGHGSPVFLAASRRSTSWSRAATRKGRGKRHLNRPQAQPWWHPAQTSVSAGSIPALAEAPTLQLTALPECRASSCALPRPRARARRSCSSSAASSSRCRARPPRTSCCQSVVAA